VEKDGAVGRIAGEASGEEMTTFLFGFLKLFSSSRE
jgi:hypothetical protein